MSKLNINIKKYTGPIKTFVSRSTSNFNLRFSKRGIIIFIIGFSIIGTYQLIRSRAATTLTWNNAPSLGNILSTSGAASKGAWVEFDVKAAITGDGTYSFAVVSDNTDYVEYSSKEGANDPQLVLQ